MSFEKDDNDIDLHIDLLWSLRQEKHVAETQELNP